MPLSPEIQLNLDAKNAFYEAIVADIRTRGDQLVSPLWALSKLGATFKPEARVLIMQKLLDTKHAQNIGFVRTQKGLRFPAGNIDALDRAFGEIYLAGDTRASFTQSYRSDLATI